MVQHFGPYLYKYKGVFQGQLIAVVKGNQYLDGSFHDNYTTKHDSTETHNESYLCP